MKMKRMFAAAVALVLFCTGLAFAQEETQEDDWYLETASELARCVGELAGDEAYMQMMTSNPFDILAPLQEADFTSVAGAWRLAVDESAFSQADGLDWDGMTAIGRDALLSKLPSVLLTQWNAYVSTEAVAASTMLAYMRTYSMPEDFEQCALILRFDGAQVGVAFMQTGEDTITATAYPLFLAEDSSLEESIEAISQGDVPLMAVEKLF